jgi:RNA polymerase sigma-70 factor, ECF subfamily
MDPTDDELAKSAMAGDWASFIALCRRHYRTMVCLARATLGDGHLAEDAVQEAFAKACKCIASLKNPARFTAWLAAICRNQALEILRKNPPLQSLGERDFPKEMLEEDQDVEEVRNILNELPAETRELLYLRYRDDRGCQEIADLLEISLEAVHGRLKRAKADVKVRLEQSRKLWRSS